MHNNFSVKLYQYQSVSVCYNTVYYKDSSLGALSSQWGEWGENIHFIYLSLRRWCDFLVEQKYPHCYSNELVSNHPHWRDFDRGV